MMLLTSPRWGMTDVERCCSTWAGAGKSLLKIGGAPGDLCLAFHPSDLGARQEANEFGLTLRACFCEYEL